MKKIFMCILILILSTEIFIVHAKSKRKSNISYEEIIVTINDANIAQKNNNRTKKIVKEYTYNVGDDDSKNSSREYAVAQLKTIILDEIGVFVESYLQIETLTDDKSKQYVREEIKSLTAGIVKLKILDEKYNGETYYVKASVEVDPDSVSEGITEVLKIRANQQEIEDLEKILTSKEKEIDMRSTELLSLQKKVSGQTLLLDAKETEISDLESKIVTLNNQLNKYQEDEKKLKVELTKAQEKVNIAVKRIKNETSNAQVIQIGMTKYEVFDILGIPTGAGNGSQCNTDHYEYGRFTDWCTSWYYGTRNLKFNTAGLVIKITNLDN